MVVATFEATTGDPGKGSSTPTRPHVAFTGVPEAALPELLFSLIVILHLIGQVVSDKEHPVLEGVVDGVTEQVVSNVLQGALQGCVVQ
jgi:hypothetical protein